MTNSAACDCCGASLSSGYLAQGMCSACLMRLALARTETEEDGAEVPDPFVALPGLPRTIGPYRILSVLGEGGMGIVYLAEQESPLKRTVAVKVVKFGMDTREVVRRFDAERDVLALMSHPNIARALDAGSSDDGRPYFVMEYVQGAPITEYCDENSLGIPERLRLFIPVCRALQHAHQRGVIHRDLKPSNILVTLQDGRPVPKVIDFGIAKATDQRQAERTAFTRLGVLLGTPEYMSPEQADGSREIDTTTDIYSLGVVLYELLVGVLPFTTSDLRNAGYEELLRIVRHEEPARPSLRLTMLDDVRREVERSRATELSSLRKQIRGDLDWIVLRALEKDRTRRYASASELAGDLERHLADEPVTATPPNFIYRGQKLLRKHRAAVFAVAAILVTLLGGLVTSTAMFLRASEAQRQAERQRQIAEVQSYVANIGAAEVLLRDHQTGEAERRLADAPLALRDWEWNYLSRRADPSDGILWRGERPVISARFSADGKRILWINDAGLLGSLGVDVLPAQSVTWPQRTSRPSRSVVAVDADGSAYLSTSWRLPLKSISLGRFRPGGPRLLVAGPPDDSAESRTLTITEVQSDLDVAHLVLPSIGRSGPLAIPPSADVMFNKRGIADFTGRPQLVTSGQEGSVVSAAFSADGRFVATWTWDNVLRVWNVRDGTVRGTFAGHHDGIAEAAFSPDGTRIASASHDGTIRVWNLDSRDAPALLVGHAGGVTAVAWSPDGRHLASGGVDNTVRWWSQFGGLEATLTGHRRPITAVAVMPDGHRLVSGSEDRTIRYWDVAIRRELAVLAGHRGDVRTVAASSDGRHIVSGSSDGSLRMWATPQVQPLAGDLRWLAASEAGRFVAVTKDGCARLWTLDRPVPLATLDGLSEGPVAISRSGQVVALASRDHTLCIWHVERNNVLTLRGLSAGITAIALDTEGRRAASATASDGVRIWDLSSQATLHVDAVGELHLLGFSADGRWLAGAADKRLTIWDARTGAEYFAHDFTDHPQGEISSLAFSSDSQNLAIAWGYGSPDRSIGIWRLRTKTQAIRLNDQDKTTVSMAFDRSGTRLLSSYDDGTVQVWDLERQRPLLSFSGGKSAVRWLQFMSDGARVLAVSNEMASVLDGSAGRGAPHTNSR